MADTTLELLATRVIVDIGEVVEVDGIIQLVK